MTSKYPANGRGVRPKVCRECGATSAEGAEISFRGLCLECGTERAGDAARQLSDGAGPYYEQWRHRMIEHAHRLIGT